jgi:hypothetical protein
MINSTEIIGFRGKYAQYAYETTLFSNTSLDYSGYTSIIKPLQLYLSSEVIL